MNRILACATVFLAIGGPLLALAQEAGNWRAASSTAKSITGDIALYNQKIAINFSAFTIAQIRSLSAAELGAVFDADSASPGSGNLYRLSIPASKIFLHHNTICGSDDTQWMATHVDGRSLTIAFFSGEQMPVFTLEALNSSSNLCGTFAYVK